MAEKESVQFPVPGFRFSVRIAGAGNNDADASFQEISGISTEVPVEEIQEGGENRFVHRVPQPLKYSNLVLKRGVVNESSGLTEWCKRTINSGFATHVELKNVVITLLSDTNKPILTWTFINAYPVKWDPGDLNAEESKLVIESMEITYNYFNIV